jgi:hypothetical protein
MNLSEFFFATYCYNFKSAQARRVYVDWDKQMLVKCRKICIEINNDVFETVDVAKLLGVNIDCSLSWSYSIDILTKKISKKLGVLRRLSSFMSSFALLKVYNSVIFPHFNYCCTIWSGANKYCEY